VLADRVRRGEIVPAAGVEQAMRTDYAPQTLLAMREQAFSIVADHADRHLAAYRAGGRTAAAQARPRILGCASPRAGMEPLIRRSAALAAQVAGDLLVTVVQPSSPSAATERLVSGYAALTAQLGGEFAVLRGAPAAELTAFALAQQVTELVLARDTPVRAGRHRVLRELAGQSGAAEVHVLPAPSTT